MTPLNRTLVIIIQYGIYTELAKCLQRMTEDSTPSVDICVVDNNPKASQLRSFYVDFPDAQVIYNEKNLGFSGGCNAGLRKGLKQGYDYFFIINNDAYLPAEDIIKLEKMMDADPTMGILGPVVHDASKGLYYYGASVNWKRGKSPYNEETQLSASDELHEVDLVLGCGMLIPRHVLEADCFFDEDYFLYWEDTAICYRVREAGYRCVVASGIALEHTPSQTTGDGSPLREYYMVRNGLRFFGHYTPGYFARVSLLIRISLSRFVVGLRHLVRGDRVGGWARIWGVWDYWRGRLGRTPRFDHGGE